MVGNWEEEEEKNQEQINQCVSTMAAAAAATTTMTANNDNGFMHLPTLTHTQGKGIQISIYVQFIAQPIQRKIICKWRIIEKTIFSVARHRFAYLLALARSLVHSSRVSLFAKVCLVLCNKKYFYTYKHIANNFLCYWTLKCKWIAAKYPAQHLYRKWIGVCVCVGIYSSREMGIINGTQILITK